MTRRVKVQRPSPIAAGAYVTRSYSHVAGGVVVRVTAGSICEVVWDDGYSSVMSATDLVDRTPVFHLVSRDQKRRRV